MANEGQLVAGAAIAAGVAVGVYLATRPSTPPPPPPGAPPPPTGLGASAITDTTVLLTWTTSVGADGYHVVQNGQPIAADPITPGSATSVTVTGLSAATTYHFAVDAYNASGSSAPTADVVVTTLPTGTQVPPAPTGLVASNVLDTSCDLTWSASAGATSYTPMEGTTALTTVATTSAHVTGLSPQTTYSFAVEAANSAGSSAPSASITVTTPPTNPGAPPPPSGLAATNVTPNSCDLTWVASLGATGYTPFEGTTALANVISPGAHVAGLHGNTTYHFTVVAFNTAGSSAPSAVVTVTTPPALTVPPVPAGLVASNVTAAALDLTWAASAGATSYIPFEGTTAFNQIALPAVTTPGAHISGLSGGKTYDFAVQAVNAVGHSAKSALLAVTTPPGVGVKPVDTLVLIILENVNYTQVTAPGAAPYVMSLARAGAFANNDHGVSHPSAPNYLSLTSGVLLQPGSDAYNVYPNRNLVDLLEAAGVSWGAYMEGMPAGQPVGDTGNYITHHDPFAYYANIINSPQRKAKIKPFSQFSPGSMERFVWITPDVTHDMHAPQGTIAASDAWLAAHVPAILGSAAFGGGRNSLLILTWDEGDGSTTNQTLLIFAGPAARAGAVSANKYNHYDTLHTIEAVLGLQSLGTNDVTAAIEADMLAP